MGRERTSASGVEAELAKHKGVEIHGGSIRVVFMWRRIRCRETLGLPATKANIKHAALLRAAILHEIKTGHFEYGRHFPNSKNADNYTAVKDERIGALMERYKPLKAVDITPMTEEKYGYALDICADLLGSERLAGILLCIPVMLPTGSSDCDPPVLEVLPSHSSGCDPLRRRSCPIPKACRCVIART